MSRSSKIALTIALALVMIVWGFLNVKKANASLEWPQVTGQVIISRIDRRTTRSSEDSSTVYRVTVRYEYTVDGTDYTSSTIDFGGQKRYEMRSMASKFIRSYPKDKEVTVYYNPSNHSDAVLNPGADFWSYRLVLVGFLLLFGGPPLVIFGRQITGRKIGLFSRK